MISIIILLLVVLGLVLLIQKRDILFSKGKIDIDMQAFPQFMRDEEFLPYGGLIFSKKTVIKIVDNIIDDGYQLKFRERFEEAKAIFKLIWKRLLLWTVPLALAGTGVFFVLDSFVSSHEEVLLNISLFILLVPLLLINVHKILFKIKIKGSYLKIVQFLVYYLILFLVLSNQTTNSITNPISASSNFHVLGLLIWLYLSISYAFAIPLILSTPLGVWFSMEVSRKVVTRNWTNIAAHLLIVNMIVYSGILLFGIGTLLTAPFGLAYYYAMFKSVFSQALKEYDKN